MPRIALYGKPGAGKSTLATLLAQEWEKLGRKVLTLKLGAPLYELQSIVYAVAGCPLVEGGVQDGRLLNLLGGELRRINPSALTEPFGKRVQQAGQMWPEAIVVCDDMRAADVEAIIALGFALVEITAPEELRRRRRAARADLSAGDENHSTEAAVAAQPWRQVDNSGSVDDLRKHGAELAREVLR